MGSHLKKLKDGCKMTKMKMAALFESPHFDPNHSFLSSIEAEIITFPS